MIICKDCEYYYSNKEHQIDGEFIFGKGHCCVIKMDGGDGIECCQHNVCFKTVSHTSPINGLVVSKNRIAGQAQLNKDNNCKFFKQEKPWWQFWKEV